MQAQMSQDGDISIIHLAGRVDVETAEPFRAVCVGRLNGKKMVFDFTALSFVGSSGIIPFLQILQDFATTNQNNLKFSGVGGEFKKIFAATPLRTIEICDTPKLAIEAFSRPFQMPSLQDSVFAAAAVPMNPASLLNGVEDNSVGEVPTELLSLRYEVESD